MGRRGGGEAEGWRRRGDRSPGRAATWADAGAVSQIALAAAAPSRPPPPRSGQRYLAWSAERHNVEAISRRIRHLLPELGLAEPEIDDAHAEEIKAREAELRANWARCDLRNDRVRAVTGVRFRPVDESLRDCVESLLAGGQVQPRLARSTASTELRTITSP